MEYEEHESEFDIEDEDKEKEESKGDYKDQDGGLPVKKCIILSLNIIRTKCVNWS